MIVETKPKFRLDLSEIDPSERHERIFNDFDGLKIGESMDVIVDHDPKLLERQFRELRGGLYSWNITLGEAGLRKLTLIRLSGVPLGQQEQRPHGCCGICGND